MIARLGVSATGCVTSMAIVGSSGSEMLDSAVVQFFESTEFMPAEVEGKAIETTVSVPMVFKLQFGN